MREGSDEHMTRKEIVDALTKLTPVERLVVVEAALVLLREDLQRLARSGIRSKEKSQLAAAAEALRADYEGDAELTSFTALDSDDLHA